MSTSNGLTHVFKFVPYAVTIPVDEKSNDDPNVENTPQVQSSFTGTSRLIDVNEERWVSARSPDFKLPAGRYRVCATVWARFNQAQGVLPGPLIEGDELYREIGKKYGKEFDVDPPAGVGGTGRNNEDQRF